MKNMMDLSMYICNYKHFSKWKYKLILLLYHQINAFFVHTRKISISKLSNKIRSLVSEFQNVITDCAYMTTTQGTWPQQWNVTERPFQIVMPRGAKQAKGLLLSCIEEPDPCIIFEPKILYRTAIDDVPTADYKIEIGKAEVVREGRRGGRQVLWISFTL